MPFQGPAYKNLGLHAASIFAAIEKRKPLDRFRRRGKGIRRREFKRLDAAAWGRKTCSQAVG
jgi:hypothetical protein